MYVILNIIFYEGAHYRIDACPSFVQFGFMETPKKLKQTKEGENKKNKHFYYYIELLRFITMFCGTDSVPQIMP